VEVSAYYNENDPFAAAWLRELIKAGLIADGEVDERDIRDVRPEDVRGFTQCHFFAGIGGWSYALRLAGWDDSRAVWTGSCPCQGYSAAGKREGAADARNLWPEWFRLIRECRPSRVFGEQVEAAVRHGWLDDVATNMEAEGYAIGAAVLGAHSVGAPHKRQRLWFVADSESHRLEEQWLPAKGRQVVADVGRGRGMRQDATLADAEVFAQREPAEAPDAITTSGNARPEFSGGCEYVADANGQSSVWPAITRPERHPWSVEPALGRVAHGLPHKLVEPFLRGYGNAIVPQVAAAFVSAYLDVLSGDAGTAATELDAPSVSEGFDRAR
jgi:DNA (cytosine-5)-methyltransferase 1